MTSSPSPARARLRRAGLFTVAAAAAAACIVPPTAALAVTTVTTANAAAWQIHDAAPPGLDTGSIRALSNSGVDGFGNIFVRVSTAPESRFNGEMMRGFGLTSDGSSSYSSTQAVDLGGIDITRDIDLSVENNRARFFDTFTNTTAAPATVEVSFGWCPRIRRRRRSDPDPHDVQRGRSRHPRGCLDTLGFLRRQPASDRRRARLPRPLRGHSHRHRQPRAQPVPDADGHFGA